MGTLVSARLLKLFPNFAYALYHALNFCLYYFNRDIQQYALINRAKDKACSYPGTRLWKDLKYWKVLAFLTDRKSTVPPTAGVVP